MLIDGPWNAQLRALWDILDKLRRCSTPQFPLPIALLLSLGRALGQEGMKHWVLAVRLGPGVPSPGQTQHCSWEYAQLKSGSSQMERE